MDSSNPCRILVADDYRDATDSLTLLLELWGHRARAAYDGHSAVAIAREFDPKLVFLDLDLPGLDGYQVAERLRKQNTDMTIIALTGWSRTEDRHRTSQAGFNEHLLKPLGDEALQQVLLRYGCRISADR